MTADLFMGVDIGTSGIRAAVFSEYGEEKGFCYKEYPMISTTEGMAELDPELLFDSFIGVARDCFGQNNIPGNSVAAIGISTQMFSFLAVNRDGNALTNLITWADTRSLQDVRYVESNFDCKRLYFKTGCRAQHPIYHISKILWLKRTQPELFEKIYKFVTIKEYILHKMFGVYYVDITDASTSACFNINTFKWDEDILKEVLQVGEGKFGETVDCTHTLKGMKENYAREMGLRASIPIVIGSGDGIMANVGCGGIDNTTMSSTIGTSGALRIAVDKPLLDEKMRTWCYCFTRNQWVAGGAINNGGIVLKWFREQYRAQFEKEAETLQFDSVYKLFDHYVSQTFPGSEGLFFLPFLTGERSPGWNADANAYICGLKITHDKKHIVRAAMEGIMYNMYSIYGVLDNLGGNVRRIIANGGYVNSSVWLQMQADIFNKEITVAPIGEASVWGAAFTSMVATGVVRGFDDVRPGFKPGRVIQPNVENHTIYNEAFRRYQELYHMLVDKNEINRLGALNMTGV
jgi:gluconokinase